MGGKWYGRESHRFNVVIIPVVGLRNIVDVPPMDFYIWILTMRTTRPRGYENVTPIARNDIPLVGHWCMKQLSIDNVSQSRGGYIRGVSQGRAVITWNCVKFLLPCPEGLTSWSFDAGTTDWIKKMDSALTGATFCHLSVFGKHLDLLPRRNFQVFLSLECSFLKSKRSMIDIFVQYIAIFLWITNIWNNYYKQK